MKKVLILAVSILLVAAGCSDLSNPVNVTDDKPDNTPYWSMAGVNNEAEPMTGNDGKVYETIRIGNQIWMAENLQETQYRSGDEIPNVTANAAWAALSSGARSAYFNLERNAEIYGYLYNWYAAEDSRNIAPEGWRVPTDEDWEILTNYLGGWQVAGGKLKTTGIEGIAGPMVVNFVAGQTIVAGTIIVSITEDELVLNFSTSENWLIKELQFHIAKEFSDLPTNRSGNPIPGQFAYKYEYSEGIKHAEFRIPLADHDLQPGDEIYIAAHAVLQRLENGIVVQEETGWGEGERFDNRNWAMYFKYKAEQPKEGTEWKAPNNGATNESGFSAVPAGYRIANDGGFAALTQFAVFWTQTEYNENEAWERKLDNRDVQAWRQRLDKRSGLSIRLIKE